ncbi:hypothetical protein BJ969_003764 [Saccharopolyspora gloriosae]|uniref:Uncharacterized protein n=1 Tax=Saccharopolyspora gloriosae TaxID=455344 RepID=A0A840NE97_9PSEU|nr:hypothetical protein [Saccharopolyspora gloriosae]
MSVRGPENFARAESRSEEVLVEVRVSADCDADLRVRSFPRLARPCQDLVLTYLRTDDSRKVAVTVNPRRSG